MGAGSVKTRFRPETGVGSYDASEWLEPPPQTEVLWNSGGMSCLYQKNNGGEGSSNEVTLPSSGAHVLFFHRFGAPKINCRVANRRHNGRVQPWDGSFLPFGVDGWWDNATESARDVFHLHLTPAYLGQLCDQDGRLPPGGLSPRVLNLSPELRTLAQALHFAAEREERSTLYWTGAATMVGMQLLVMSGTPQPAAMRGGLAPWQVERVCDYIRDHLEQPVAIETLAALIDLSPHHFCRAFKASTGLPPHRWQLEERVRRAEEMMRANRDDLAEIALRCGFFDQSHFTRAFQRHRGISPGRWRRTLAN